MHWLQEVDSDSRRVSQICGRITSEECEMGPWWRHTVGKRELALWKKSLLFEVLWQSSTAQSGRNVSVTKSQVT